MSQKFKKAASRDALDVKIVRHKPLHRAEVRKGWRKRAICEQCKRHTIAQCLGSFH